MADLSTFLLSDIIELIGNAAVPRGAGLDVSCDGIDDEVFGCVVSDEKTYSNFLQQHKGVYNFQILDGGAGNVITCRRVPVGDDLAVDLDIDEGDCIRRGESPHIQFVRSDPVSLPRSIEIQYSDPDRGYAISTQNATYHSAPRTNGMLSLPIDFVISADQARALAFDYLYRIWGNQIGLAFEHPDTRIEPGDVINITAGSRIYTCLVQEQTLTRDRTSMVKATALLTSRGIIIPGQTPEAGTSTATEDLGALLLLG